MRIAVALVLVAACGDASAPPAPSPAPVSRPASPPPAPKARTRLPTMAALVDRAIDATKRGARAEIESMLFTDAEIRAACREKPELATSAISMRDPTGFSRKRPDHRATYDACFALPWTGATYQVVGSLLGAAVPGCRGMEVVAIVITVETSKGPYLLEIKDAIQIGGRVGLTTLPGCKPAQ